MAKHCKYSASLPAPDISLSKLGRDDYDIAQVMMTGVHTCVPFLMAAHDLALNMAQSRAGEAEGKLKIILLERDEIYNKTDLMKRDFDAIIDGASKLSSERGAVEAALRQQIALSEQKDQRIAALTSANNNLRTTNESFTDERLTLLKTNALLTAELELARLKPREGIEGQLEVQTAELRVMTAKFELCAWELRLEKKRSQKLLGEAKH